MSTRDSQPSVFVTVVAWVFIILSGFATFVAIMQNITVHFLLSVDEMRRAMQTQSDGQTPHMTGLMFEHIDILVIVMLLLAVLALAASIGLLLRKNWARITFIGLMIVAIFWNLASLVMQQMFLQGMPMQEEGAAEFARQAQGMMNVLNAFSILLALLLSVLFGWIAWRLASKDIRREFIGSQPR